MRFLRPRVPILSQKLSSFSSFLADIGAGRGDFGRGDAMTASPMVRRKYTRRQRSRINAAFPVYVLIHTRRHAARTVWMYGSEGERRARTRDRIGIYISDGGDGDACGLGTLYLLCCDVIEWVGAAIFEGEGYGIGAQTWGNLKTELGKRFRFWSWKKL